jgi:hypothetical protein
MRANPKKDIYVSDILLLMLALLVFGFFIYKIIIAANIHESLQYLLFLIAVILFLFKGYSLNTFRKRKSNLKELNFFEYYEEELEMLMKYKVNMQLFFPVMKKEENKELDGYRKKINVITIVMYSCLLLSFIV